MNKPAPNGFGPRRRQGGLSLIELMISMVLGLLVVGGAIGVFLSNQQTYRATESLARVQENARVAFELMAREVREAAGNACGNNVPTANVIKGGSSFWWGNWRDGLNGYDNGAYAKSATGTDAIELISATSGGVTVVSHNPASAQFHVSTTKHGFEDGDVLLACDYSQAAIFQVTGANASNTTVVHNSGGGVASPGNCTKGLGLPMECTTLGTPKEYGPNSKVAKLRASRWYVADNNRPGGGRSLYRMQMDLGGDGTAEEITEGIQNMQLQYLLAGKSAYVDGSAVAAADWVKVIAVRIELTVQGTEEVGTDGKPLTRRIAHVVTLRNRSS